MLLVYLSSRISNKLFKYSRLFEINIKLLFLFFLLFPKLSEIIVENVSIAWFTVTTGWLRIFLPYIHPNIHCFSVFHTKKKIGDFPPIPSTGHHPGSPRPLRPPATIVLAWSKIDAPIFLLYYPLTVDSQKLELSGDQKNSLSYWEFKFSRNGLKTMKITELLS